MPTSGEGADGVPAVGDLIAGKFEVERVLGVGGMGAVVAARNVKLGQRVAVKVLLAGAMRDPDTVDRFLREGRTAARIESDHVVRVLDVGNTEDGAPFLVMEHLEGTDLKTLLQERGPLPIDECVDYVLQAIRGVEDAHALGVVHRDLKPANLFLATRPDGSRSIKVLDFGISKSLSRDERDADANVTSTRAMIGSPAYMAPEQVRNARDVDLRTDVWALGVTLYELTTGHPPFRADAVGGVLAAIAADRPEPPRAKRPDMPAAVEAVILKCLEKERSARFPTVAALAHALDASRKSAPRSARATVAIAAGIALAASLGVGFFVQSRGSHVAASAPPRPAPPASASEEPVSPPSVTANAPIAPAASLESSAPGTAPPASARPPKVGRASAKAAPSAMPSASSAPYDPGKDTQH